MVRRRGEGEEGGGRGGVVVVGHTHTHMHTHTQHHIARASSSFFSASAVLHCQRANAHAASAAAPHGPVSNGPVRAVPGRSGPCRAAPGGVEVGPGQLGRVEARVLGHGCLPRRLRGARVTPCARAWTLVLVCLFVCLFCWLFVCLFVCLFGVCVCVCARALEHAGVRDADTQTRMLVRKSAAQHASRRGERILPGFFASRLR